MHRTCHSNLKNTPDISRKIYERYKFYTGWYASEERLLRLCRRVWGWVCSLPEAANLSSSAFQINSQFSDGPCSISPTHSGKQRLLLRPPVYCSPVSPLMAQWLPSIRIWKSGVKKIQTRARCGMSTGCSLSCVIGAAWPVQKDGRDGSRQVPGMSRIMTPVLRSHRTYFTAQQR